MSRLEAIKGGDGQNKLL